jgi:5-methylcytosine-specific restriction endonuclease McrA
MATLLLNADGIPVSYLPLSILSWQESIKYMVLEKARVLESYDDWIVHSPTWSVAVPAVMMLLEYEKRKATLRFSKQNIFLRDGYECQYCGVEVNRKTATLDHVLPISKGGKSVWDNCTTACGRCNALKGNKSGVFPKVKPFKPNYFALVEKRKKMSYDLRHESWKNYLV